MIYQSILRESRALSSASLATPFGREAWEGTVDERRRAWRRMLGIEPLPEPTPLHATVTGVLERGDYVVEKIHFQSSPGAYVAGNLYRPAQVAGPLPAVLYLCGHTKGKVNPPYQANPRWFGQHGYAALVLDPIQLGESQGYHGGTIFKEWFDWYSRGYTPAGVEVWNAIRALDYLETRNDVDAGRMGVTGLSGGGAISWFLAAADERIQCAVPVCQTGTVEQHAADRTVDGHCDCAFWINLFRWDTPDVGALIAPRPLLVASGTEDVIWRPYAWREIARRLDKQYAALDVGDRFNLVADASPHGYTPKLRKAIFQWFNHWLKDDDTPVLDDVTDYVEPEENLLVFDGAPPEHTRIKDVDRWFVPIANSAIPEGRSGIETWRTEKLAALKTLTFRQTVSPGPPRLVEVRPAGTDGRTGCSAETWVFATDDGLELRAHWVHHPDAPAGAPLLLLPQKPDAERIFFCAPPLGQGLDSLTVDVRGTGATALGPGMHATARRLYMNLGCSLPERQVHDLLAALALAVELRGYSAAVVYGRAELAPLAVYAGLLTDRIAEIILESPPATHCDHDTAEFLAVLQTGDLPQNLALACPRSVTLIGAIPDPYQVVDRVYAAFGQPDAVRRLSDRQEWRPVDVRP